MTVAASDSAGVGCWARGGLSVAKTLQLTKKTRCTLFVFSSLLPNLPFSPLGGGEGSEGPKRKGNVQKSQAQSGRNTLLA